MKPGDMVRLREKMGSGYGHEDHVVMYTDAQMKKIESLVYLENYSFNFKGSEQPAMGYEETALVLGMKDVHKDGNGIDVIWNRFVKVLTNGGSIGWLPKIRLERIFK
jgi:hypothetical protein